MSSYGFLPQIRFSFEQFLKEIFDQWITVYTKGKSKS